MNQTLRPCFTLGLILTGGLTKLCQAATVDTREPNPAMTIHVYNYAAVSPKTLVEAEKVAAGIFRKAGVDTRRLDRHRNSDKKQEDSEDDPKPFHSSEIVLHVLSRSMPERFGLTSERLGFAPGQGPDRRDAYVFYDRAEQLAQRQSAARMERALVGIVDPCASIGQILGHVIAHELGHLQGLDSHSATGVMRADWDSADLQDAIQGCFQFTREQAEVIRAEVSRRIGQQETTQQGWDRSEAPSRAERCSGETQLDAPNVSTYIPPGKSLALIGNASAEIGSRI
jgi:hypothetical protein